MRNNRDRKTSLTLTRRQGQSIYIGDDIEVAISRVAGDQVAVTVIAPRRIVIRRAELPPLTPAHEESEK